MAEQERERGRSSEDGTDTAVPEDQLAHPGEELTGRIDDLLEEIDFVLEDNAEEFVKNYVQKGGQ